MSVKLGVGAWYKAPNGYYVQYERWGRDCIGYDNHLFYDPTIGINSWGEEYWPQIAAQTYHIEPGDRVRPKPAGDKCWEKYGRRPEVIAYGEFVVEDMGSCGKRPGPKDQDWGVNVECLILLEKGAKAPAQDFQVGDEPAGNFKLIRRAGEIKAAGDDTESKPHYCPKCGQEFYRGKDDPLICVDCFNREQTKGKLNPRVLPSVSGSELLWPDVRPGIELDKLPEDKSTIEDRDANAWSTQTVSTAKAVLNFLCSVETNLGKTNNADRERIRKIIPEIERKLTQLKGRL